MPRFSPTARNRSVRSCGERLAKSSMIQILRRRGVAVELPLRYWPPTPAKPASAQSLSLIPRQGGARKVATGLVRHRMPSQMFQCLNDQGAGMVLDAEILTGHMTQVNHEVSRIQCLRSATGQIDHLRRHLRGEPQQVRRRRSRGQQFGPPFRRAAAAATWSGAGGTTTLKRGFTRGRS